MKFTIIKLLLIISIGLSGVANAATIFGDPKGDITIIEYLDYNCPICREYTPLLGYFATKNKGIKVIQKVVPVLSPESRFVDSAILASIHQGKFAAMQAKILLVSDPESITPQEVLAIAEQLGMNQQQLINDMKSKAIQDELLTNTTAYERTGQKVIPVTVIYLTNKPENTVILSGYQTIAVLENTIKQLRAS